MDDVRLGRLLRAVRRNLGLRQLDVARAARVSQQTVSRLERGQLEHVSIPVARRIARAVDVSLDLSARWRGSAGDRLLDQAHAALVEVVVRELRSTGFEVLVEYTFSHYGERGSVDIVGWHPVRRALLVVEIKSDLVDTQELNAGLDRKARLVPQLLHAERGWRADAVGRVVVLPDRTAIRARIARHATTFDAALPARTRAVRRWLRDPNGPLAAIWLVRDTRRASAMRGGPSRIRVAGPRRRSETSRRAA
jgi:transcriptional regulator with XRE-family HTH domain